MAGLCCTPLRLEIKFSQMKSKTAESPSAEPIVFKIGIMLPAEGEGQMSRLIPAGSPSPFTSEDQVPERLRQYIGEPPKENYDVASFRRTTELINEQSGGEMSESVRSALASIDDEIHARAQARAAAVIRNENPKGLYDDRS
jgi:hypothetical protein